ncbi:MAG: hypothetical protein WAT39_21395 [Planctomycetota bacterium]
MKRVCSLLLALSLAPAAATAQALDIGLTLSGGMLTVIFGQDCGPVTCTPLFGGNVGRGQARSVMHYSAPATLYAIAIGIPAPCLAIPGIDNVLLLGTPVIFDWGITSAPPFVPTACQQGVAGASFTIPLTAPVGVQFRLQSFGQSNGGAWALGPAIECTIV